MWAQLGIEDHFCDFDVAQCLLASSEHEEAGGQVVKDTSRLHMLKSKHVLSDFPRFQEASSSEVILLHLIKDFSHPKERQRPVRISEGQSRSVCKLPAVVKDLKGIF